jgi:RNA polymerase subunit RPABC4/transcription elongation factor Spt4
MPEQNHCPTCGARLPGPGQKCPFCADAQKLLDQLVSKEDVRVCTRCGAIVEEENEDLCKNCRTAIPRRSVWGREGSVTQWIQGLVEEAGDESETEPCPHCGKIIPSVSIFCPNCGKPMATDDEPAAEPEEPAAAPADTPPDDAAEPEEPAATPTDAPPDDAAEPEEPATTPADAPPDDVVDPEEPTAEPTPEPAAEPVSPPDATADTRPLPVEPVRGPSPEPTPWERVLGFFRAFRGMDRRNLTVWIVLVVMLLVLGALALAWRWLLSSGTITLP